MDSASKDYECLGEMHKIARAQTLIAMCSTVPNYWFTVLFIDRIGRFVNQLMDLPGQISVHLPRHLCYIRKARGNRGGIWVRLLGSEPRVGQVPESNGKSLEEMSGESNEENNK
ncbi:hypothetical protein G4B88_024701 [Cannabis sativa]|uniref:Uncharacterized protein n=1 Tax=Cannabis sativa TaxID=3483 RepID=A0A7J6GYC8_CANSA|nr:hypothetical protein G4B88_024701 [Cannabis sativa]